MQVQICWVVTVVHAEWEWIALLWLVDQGVLVSQWDHSKWQERITSAEWTCLGAAVGDLGGNRVPLRQGHVLCTHIYTSVCSISIIKLSAHFLWFRYRHTLTVFLSLKKSDMVVKSKQCVLNDGIQCTCIIFCKLYLLLLYLA